MAVAGPLLYSTNPTIASQIAVKYRHGKHFVWCSEAHSPALAPVGSLIAAIAPSSSPTEIFLELKNACDREDRHNSKIKAYRKTYCRLADEWFANNDITDVERDEIKGIVRSHSWNIWRPVLYIIPRAPIEAAGRLIQVPHRSRAAVGPELQIVDLLPTEFDMMRSLL